MQWTRRIRLMRTIGNRFWTREKMKDYRCKRLDARLLEARLLDARLLDARLLDARRLDARP